MIDDGVLVSDPGKENKFIASLEAKDGAEKDAIKTSTPIKSKEGFTDSTNDNLKVAPKLTSFREPLSFSPSFSFSVFLCFLSFFSFYTFKNLDKTDIYICMSTLE